MRLTTTTTTIATATIAAIAGSASAQFSLQITEMWPGNEPGENLTADWFEITNTGDTDFIFGTDGFLFFDDDSQDPTTADLLSGVGSIAAGESVVFVDDVDNAEFLSVWFNGDTGLQVGVYSGSGLGQGGDGVTLFLGATDDFNDLDAMSVIDFQEYPDAEFAGGASWDVVLSDFSTVGNASGAFASFLSNDVGQFATGSPGSVVPTPGAIAALGLAGFTATRRRR